jgi:hypothetical protein
MNAHTPGPWRYKSCEDTNYMRIYCSNDPSEGDNLRGYCGEANARLIAAAPELLEALRRARPHIGVGYSAVQQYEITRLVDAAVAKATGEKP